MGLDRGVKKKYNNKKNVYQRSFLGGTNKIELVNFSTFSYPSKLYAIYQLKFSLLFSGCGKSRSYSSLSYKGSSKGATLDYPYNSSKGFTKGVEVKITDLETKVSTTYESINKAAKAINSDIKSLSRLKKKIRIRTRY